MVSKVSVNYLFVDRCIFFWVCGRGPRWSLFPCLLVFRDGGGVLTPERDLGLQKFQGLNDFSLFLLTFLGDSKNEVHLPLSLLV